MKKTINVSLPVEMIQELDHERGDVTRSRFVLRALEPYLESRRAGGTGTGTGTGGKKR